MTSPAAGRDPIDIEDPKVCVVKWNYTNLQIGVAVLSIGHEEVVGGDGPGSCRR